MTLRTQTPGRQSGAPTRKFVRLGELADVSILFEGDLHAAATLMLRGYDVLERTARQHIRPNLRTVAGQFAGLFCTLQRATVEGKLEQLGFDLEATLEKDEFDTPARPPDPATPKGAASPAPRPAPAPAPAPAPPQRPAKFPIPLPRRRTCGRS